jgi:hypothetical protein
MLPILINLACLAVEANQVVGLRLHRISLGGTVARDESILMVAEKVYASREACLHLSIGCPLDRIVSDYRALVQANVRRLSA